MKAKYFSLYILFIHICIAGCQKSGTYREFVHESKPKSYSIDLGKCDTLDFSQYYQLKSFIRLSDSLSIGEVTSIRSTLDRIFILTDSKRSSVLIIDRKGALINKLEQSEGNPNSVSYLGSVQFIYFDENLHQLEVLDRSNKKILIFDQNGEFLSSFQIPLQVISFDKISDDVYLFNCGNELNGAIKEKLVIFDKKSGKPTDSFLKIEYNRSKYLLLVDLMNFDHHADGIYYTEAFTDTIFFVNKTSRAIEPAYILDFGPNKLPISYYSQGFSNIADFLSKPRNSNYAFLLSGWYNLEKQILTSIEIKSKRMHILLNENSSRVGCYYKNYILDSGIVPTSFETLPISINNNSKEAFFVHYPGDLLNLQEKYGSLTLNNQSVMDGLKITDNPIIGIYTVK